ncbi:hypothetical protein [Agrococcus terreus]|uniref:Bacteriocin biosynthesis cyclodehydratase domain-containing protein n=1 Tax=Agrococcus terreus TaxID=574649 RepID=A0ABQ2KGZ4_9MICO|nr:hypothetical protein [Agrococcus terreus]GGN81663.1 hypothetical protein GCM10010968_10630 [Agrococcus terreus]
MLRLDPRLALFRSSPDRVSIGAQAPVAELADDDASMRGVAALVRGVLRPELDQLLGADAARELLERVGPALDAPSACIAVRVRGRLALARTIQRAARAAGHPSGEALVVPVAPWRLPAGEVRRLVADDAPHLPVVVGDAWIQVGPAGRGGCERCVGAHEGGPMPAHLVPVPGAAARWQVVATVLSGLRLAAAGELPDGWGARIAQRDGAVSALPAPLPCACRARRGTARAA